ncbi:MAG TPA: helix-turn-helix domain-containing protein [Candidatus Binatia bacterium]|nr:helix-turn-helix domain-containing protein [Candidatus Binatia bacterium]
MNTKTNEIVTVPIQSGPASLQPEILNPQLELPLETWVTAKTVLAHFGMSERTLRHYVNDLKMPHHRIGIRQMRFKFSEVQAFLEQLHANRFAATGRANALREARKRLVLIPILNGLEILAHPLTPNGSTNLARGNALGPNATNSFALKGQSNPVLSPKCKPGRKPKTSDARTCKHKFITRLHTRTCSRCGLTQHKDSSIGNWIEST